MKIFLNTYFFLFSVIVSSQNVTNPQINWLAVRSHKYEPYQIINPEGEVKFTLPLNTNGCFDYNKTPGYEELDFDFIDFSNGYFTTVKENEIIIYNQHGKITNTISCNFNWVSPISNGFFKVYMPIQNSGGSLIVYYNKLGVDTFKKKFWNASYFVDGVAVVQEYNPLEPFNKQTNHFLVIDTTGNVVKNLTREYPNFSFNRIFSNDPKSIEIATNDYKILYLNTFDLSLSTTKKRSINRDKIDSKLDSIMAKNTIGGHKIYNIGAPDYEYIGRKIIYDDYGLIVASDRKNYSLKKIFNSNGHELKINTDEVFIDTFNQFLHFFEKNKPGYIIRDPKDLTLIYKSTRKPNLINSYFFEIEYDSLNLQKILTIYSCKQKRIWPNDLTPKNAFSVEAAINNKDQIESLILKNCHQKDLNTLPVLKKLKTLIISYSFIDDLTNVLKNSGTNLTNLQIVDGGDGKLIIPNDIKLSKLENLEIKYCNYSRSDIESLIYSTPNLKYLYYRGPDYEGSLDKYPKIKFTALIKPIQVE